MNTVTAPQTPAEMKKAGILSATTELVFKYGFSRVTMDDIAKECGLSRPALYQFFRNKQEIYRAIATQMCFENLAIMDDILAKQIPAAEKVVSAVVEGKLRMVCEMEATQHGAELMDLGNELSADIIEQYTSGMLERLTKVYETAAGGKPEFSASQMATDLVFWLEGMKPQIKPLDEREAALRRFVAMQFAALKA